VIATTTYFYSRDSREPTTTTTTTTTTTAKPIVDSKMEGSSHPVMKEETNEAVREAAWSWSK
jgi:hypothetical protein